MSDMPTFFDLIISGRLDAASFKLLTEQLPGCRGREDENRTRFSGVSREALTPELKSLLLNLLDIDCVIVPTNLSLASFKCAFFDMDSTLIANECIDELAALYGVRDKIAEITERSMRGELDFEESLRARVALLAGAPASIIDEAMKRIRPTEGAKETLAFLQRHGIKTYILSGGFTQFAERIARDYGMTGYVCNSLVIEDGKLTGEVTGPAGGAILGRAGKRRSLEVISHLNGATTAQCIAGGDGANDLEMIDAAGLGFAYHAKPIVAQAAQHRINCGSFAVLADWFVESWS